MATYFDVVPKDIVNYMNQNYLREFIEEIGPVNNILIIGPDYKAKKALVQQLCTQFSETNVLWVRQLLPSCNEMWGCMMIIDHIPLNRDAWQILHRPLFQGRHYKSGLVVSTWCIGDVPPSYRYQFDYVFMFKPKHEKDEQKLRECFPGAEFHDNTITVLRQRHPEQWFFFNQE